jgi:hypothetical protein
MTTAEALFFKIADDGTRRLALTQPATLVMLPHKIQMLQLLAYLVVSKIR